MVAAQKKKNGVKGTVCLRGASSGPSLKCIYLNLYIKHKLIELATKLHVYKKFWNLKGIVEYFTTFKYEPSEPPFDSFKSWWILFLA